MHDCALSRISLSCKQFSLLLFSMEPKPKPKHDFYVVILEGILRRARRLNPTSTDLSPGLPTGLPCVRTSSLGTTLTTPEIRRSPYDVRIEDFADFEVDDNSDDDDG
ncbi:uncharacterized protein LOC119989747 [Tripterygium wilfordii]|uniref:uncharacterized protein LOC119989747 n=1 Tax=Tripterygium wilfordii TaxID=458696 RepID=UPI0018F81A17|nr:uncharacterized protein LOC119989747 [Tripterygium wilfordii]